jgi:predicted HicB family RNase H-like nuclease
MKRKEKPMKLFTCRLDPKLIDALKLKAVKEHTTVQALVAEAVQSLLKRPREEGDQ